MNEVWNLDPACRHPFMWICKSHYYGPAFCNFLYAFGGLFARGRPNRPVLRTG